MRRILSLGGLIRKSWILLLVYIEQIEAGVGYAESESWVANPYSPRVGEDSGPYYVIYTEFMLLFLL